MQDKTRILITGPPGVGKTTIIQHLYEKLSTELSLNIRGFTTAEIRNKGEREGFEIETLSKNASCLLAHIKDIKSPYAVGKYKVSVENLEKTALPEITSEAEIYLIDEIGKMECFSPSFIKSMTTLIESDKGFVIATIGQKGTGFISDIKQSQKIDLMEVTTKNRDEFPNILFERINKFFKK